MTALLLTLYGVAAVLVSTLGVWVIKGGRRTPARIALGVFLLATVVWTGQAVWAVVFPTDNPAALVAWTMPVAAVVVAHARTLVHALSDAAWRARWTDVVNLGAHPVAVTIVALVPAWHDYVVVVEDGQARYGPVFWMQVVVSYALLSKALFQLVAARAHVSSLSKRSMTTMIIGWSLPLVGNTLTVFVIGPHGPDVTPFGFVVMAPLLWRAVVHDGLTDLVPIARTQVFEHLDDAILVTDNLGRLVDANARARSLAGLMGSAQDAIGKRLEDVSPSVAQAASQMGEHDMIAGGKALVLEFSVTPLATAKGAPVGRIILARDVTEQATRARELATMHRALEAEARINERLRAELADQVVRDSGTGLHNRRYVMENLPCIVADCVADGQPLSIIVLDLDHFKAINDGHGHSAGDRVLAAVSKALQRQVPEGAVARFGGEEFIVLLPGVDAGGAFAMAEAMRSACAAVRIKARGENIRVTLSAGVATAMPPAIDAQRLIDTADAALYLAKAAGRNCARTAKVPGS